MALLGTFEGRMDPQARVVIPQKFREAVEGGMILARGLDKCIEVYPPAEWEKVASRVKQFPTLLTDARLLRQMTFANAFPANADRQGRVVMPAYLRQYAGIVDEVVMTGEDTFFGIWSPEQWDAQQAKAGDLASIAAALERDAANLERGRA